MKINKIHINDLKYPDALKEIHDPPSVLYYIGNLDVLQRISVGIVGTRLATPYGKSQAFYFAKELSIRGIAVVSGLAYGIDAAAHEGAVEGSGGTIAVLAGGLSRISPSENIFLAKKIVDKGGLLISENQDGSEIQKFEFLKRNRLISGLSKAVLIVEAAARSGSLNTAAHALGQNRDVYVIPGRITDVQSMGTNKLLQEGATPALSYVDILNGLGIEEKKAILNVNEHVSEIFQSLRESPKSSSELCEVFDFKKVYIALQELESQGFIMERNGIYAAIS